MNRVGLLGGTFDPVHSGHVQLARQALGSGMIDSLRVLPTGVPPHKVDRPLCDILHRVRMVRLAFAGISGCLVDEREARCDRPSYTVDTVISLQESNDDGACYYYIIGGDAFLEIETWHRWSELVDRVNFIVAVRKGYPKQGMASFLRRQGYREVGDDTAVETWQQCQTSRTVSLLCAAIDEVSSTGIRALVASGRPWRHLVPGSVADYIDDHHLYREDAAQLA